MNRRELLKAIAAGGVMTATGLWMPGEKVISIPSGASFKGNRLLTLDEIAQVALWEIQRAIDVVNTANAGKTHAVVYSPTDVTVSRIDDGGIIAYK